MRGLPDSAVYGTYKRIAGGGRRKPKAQVSLLEVIIEWLDGYEARVREEAKLRKIRGY
jgi:hypothetical protein